MNLNRPDLATLIIIILVSSSLPQSAWAQSYNKLDSKQTANGKVGLRLGINKEKQIVVYPVSGSPAHKQGIQDYWILTSVDKKSVKNKTCMQVAQMLKGRAGDKVTLEFLVDGKPIVKTIVRQPTEVMNLAEQSEILYRRTWQLVKNNYWDSNFNNQNWGRWKEKYKGNLKNKEDVIRAIGTMLSSLRDPCMQLIDTAEKQTQQIQVKVAILKSKIGYIRMDEITESTQAEMDKALVKLEDTNSLILDFRRAETQKFNSINDYDVNAAIELADKIVVSNEPMIMILDSDGYKQTINSKLPAQYFKPLVVLVDKNTAKNLEALTMSLKAGADAYVIGEQTAGDTSIQALQMLDDKLAIPVTIGHFMPINSTEKNKKGIKPDIEVPLSPEDIKTGHGPWWAYYKSKCSIQNPPPYGNDKQLCKAIEHLERLKESKPVSDSKTEKPIKENSSENEAYEKKNTKSSNDLPGRWKKFPNNRNLKKFLDGKSDVLHAYDAF